MENIRYYRTENPEGLSDQDKTGLTTWMWDYCLRSQGFNKSERKGIIFLKWIQTNNPASFQESPDYPYPDSPIRIKDLLNCDSPDHMLLVPESI